MPRISAVVNLSRGESIAERANTDLARRRRSWLRESPANFRQSLLIDDNGTSRPLANVLDPWQREDYEAIDPAWRRLCGQVIDVPKRRAYLERPRGHSKTTDLGAQALWALYASPRKIVGVAGAAAKKQAAFLRDGIDTIVRLNPWLADEIAVHKWMVYNRKTGSQFEILAANEATNYGQTPDFVIADELTHWPNEGLWTALFSSAAKRANCVLVVIANAGMGMGTSWHWRARELARQDPGWHFHRLDGPIASWISTAALDEQRRHLLPLAYKRLWLNQWLVAGGDVLNMDKVMAACTLRGPSLNNPFEFAMGGLDLSISEDHSGFVVLGINALAHKIRLLQLWRWNPKNYPSGRIPFGEIEATVIEAHNRYKIEGIAYDPFQAMPMIERLENLGIICYPMHPTPENRRRMATELVSAVNHDLLELFDDPNIITDLAKLNLVQKLGGAVIEAPKDENGHCDVATAFCLALPYARDALMQYAGPP